MPRRLRLIKAKGELRLKFWLQNLMISFDLKNESEAWIGDRLVCRSDTPLLSTARILLVEGADPQERLVMLRDGIPALSGRLGYAASLGVNGAVQFLGWEEQRIARQFDFQGIPTRDSPQHRNVPTAPGPYSSRPI